MMNSSAMQPRPSFDRWTRLTDAYAKQFFLMQTGDRAARVEALRLADELQRLNRAMAAAL